MADDGMLLNFAAPSDQAWAPKATFKGGRWKDRLTAKKAASHRQQKRTAEPGERPSGRSVPDYTQDESRQEFVRPPPAKRLRMDGQRDFIPGHSRGGANDRSRNEGGGQDQRPPLKQVVSSLFTYNPTSTVAKPAEEEAQDEEPVEPSNAPLSAELVPFTSLGLSPHVATHLLNKLQLKAPTAIQRKAVTQLVKDDSDAFIQAQTGSGKTLAYLLPIVQRLVNMSETMKKRVGNSGLSRESGLFAIILAPTRELSKQISTVLENLIGCAHWIVPGTVIGGEKKKSEKARLRKGMNILVATPGRLADHLENTEALDVSNVRWLVLDEGDRLMELGFEQDIQKIVSVLNLRMKARKVGLPGLPEKRTTVLCSATIKMDVQRLGEISLKNAAHLAAEGSGKKSEEGEEVAETAFSAPAQLKQAYGIVPAKLRLVTLVAVLRRAFARKGSVMKTIVFMSCADSVDFHFEVFTRAEEEAAAQDEADKSTKTETIADPEPEPALPKKLTNAKEAAKRENKIKQGGTIADTITAGNSPTLSVPNNPVQVFRLHGSLPQAVRTSTLKDFTKTTDPAVLICTDVASRGLDLPNVDFVVEYDPPFSKEDHLHRIGRTARAGRDGRALIFLQPGTEEGYVEILKEGRHDGGRGLTRHDADELLKRGFAASGVVSASANSREWEDKATTWQLDVERWALDRPKHLEQARRAYQSHIRAYATHVAAERGYFDIKQLHLGHLAKAFALRDRPGSINVPGLRPGKDGKEARKPKKGAKGAAAARGGGGKDDDEVDSGPTDAQLAFRKMRAKFNSMGGASEFNLG